MYLKVRPSDTIEFVQSNGETIIIMVGTTGIMVKANDVGTSLKVTRDSDIIISASAVRKA